MSKIQKDGAVIAAIQSDGRCLLGNAADVYRNDGILKKRYQDQLKRLGLVTQKAAPTHSYALQVYAVVPDALFTPL